MIKVFTTNESSLNAGTCLTKKFESWVESLTTSIEIINIHSNSNNYGWMLVIQYKYID